MKPAAAAVKKPVAKKPPPLPARSARAVPPPIAAPPPAPGNAAVGPAAEWVGLDTLRPWAKNPRKNDGEPVAKVAESIRRFGFAAPIVARLATREIIAGHTRWKAAQQLKLERVPVRFIDISEREAHLLALADNRLGELAEWDALNLNEVLAEFAAVDLEMAGWTTGDLAKLADHVIANGVSGEVELGAFASEKAAHKCPQCGCEFNDVE